MNKIIDFYKAREKKFQNSYFTDSWRHGDLQRKALQYAIEILEIAARDCYDEDTRTQDVMDALSFLEEHIAKTLPIRNFRSALNIEDPRSREMATNSYLKGIKAELSKIPTSLDKPEL